MYPPQGAHKVLQVVAAVRVLKYGIFSEPDLGVAMTACRQGLRLLAKEPSAAAAGCQFQVDFGPKAVNFTGFGTAIRTIGLTTKGS